MNAGAPGAAGAVWMPVCSARAPGLLVRGGEERVLNTSTQQLLKELRDSLRLNSLNSGLNAFEQLRFRNTEMRKQSHDAECGPYPPPHSAMLDAALATPPAPDAVGSRWHGRIFLTFISWCEFCCLCGSDGDAERGLKTRSLLLTERIARLASLVNRCTHHRSGTNPSFTESRNTRMSMLRVGDGVIL